MPNVQEQMAASLDSYFGSLLDQVQIYITIDTATAVDQIISGEAGPGRTNLVRPPTLAPAFWGGKRWSSGDFCAIS